jgi:regulator of replication initiation timing
MPSCDACSACDCNPLNKIQGSAYKSISEIIKLVEELQKENSILKKDNADLCKKIDKLQVNKNEIIEEIVNSLKK